ncbi:MAG: QueT transporter family protein [Candidatus Bathyarchaeota archaeon]
MKTRDLTLVTVYAALYAAMVVVFAPLSFYALQFRVAGVLRPGIAKKWELAVGYAVGVAVANLFSPFAGIYEILFMPIMSLLAGAAGYYAAKRFNGSYYVCGAVIAIIIPLSVAWMLMQLFSLPMLVTLPGLLVSEQAVNLLGATTFKAVESRIRWWET